MIFIFRNGTMGWVTKPATPVISVWRGNNEVIKTVNTLLSCSPLTLPDESIGLKKNSSQNVTQKKEKGGISEITHLHFCIYEDVAGADFEAVS